MSKLNIIQVSDVHLSRSHTYFHDNWEVFLECMNVELPDYIFVTGDLCLNGPKNPDDLIHARTQMERLPVPWLAIPGNHDIGDVPPDTRLHAPVTVDRLARYRKEFGPDFWLKDLGEWRFIGLNAQIMDSGLDAEVEQMTFLQEALEKAENRSIGLFAHKPLYLLDEAETGHSLSRIWPKSRKRLLALCEQYNVKLFASGHKHYYRHIHHGSTQLVWAPATAFVSSWGTSDSAPHMRGLGYIKYCFDGPDFNHEFIEPALSINHDMRNWMAAHGSTTHLPPRL